MVTTLNDSKRNAIAEKLADMRAIQNLLISNEQELLQNCQEDEICDRLNHMIEDDRKNLGIIETVITQYGIQAKPAETVHELVNKTQSTFKNQRLSLYDKMMQHELLKHAQVMSGLVVHKAAQVVGADVEAAITPLNTVNFENRAHQEQLKGVLEVVGTRELTGQDPDRSVWARVQDAVAALSGVVGGGVTHASDKSDMNVQDVIRMDHRKVDTLIMEIENSNDPNKIQEFFGQMYKDLTVHSEAEEQVVYPAVRQFYGDSNTQELYNEQAELKVVLNQMRSTGPSAPEFKQLLQRAKQMIKEHTTEEENQMFAAIRNNCSTQQQEQLATQFKEAKKQLQGQM